MDTISLCNKIVKKSLLLETVVNNTKSAFNLLRECSQEIIKQMQESSPEIKFVFQNKSELEFEIRFGEDILIFTMHTNTFEFSRQHEVMRLPYVNQDKERSFCGMINIYNFLTDSFDYDRDYDIGYLIGRIFINKENHYFIEGKREIGLLYSNFNTSVINKDSICSIILSSMEYANNFDLLVPPFDEVKTVNVGEMKLNSSAKRFITAKRLGFEFQQDRE
ncbi:MAG: hypothetical protein J6U84_00745 [Bacteroidales bacterium]|jgi:hypothetical protein|nr:hypothetical protein [Bacteroidales bacterium]